MLNIELKVIVLNIGGSRFQNVIAVLLIDVI